VPLPGEPVCWPLQTGGREMKSRAEERRGRERKRLCQNCNMDVEPHRYSIIVTIIE
jgi:hypothetical protein